MDNDSRSAADLIDALETDAGTKASMHRAFARRTELFGSRIYFFREPFTPVSLTGTHCSLECRHCNSYYLRHMLDGSEGRLDSQACRLANKGAKGMLLSGGSGEDGSVPTYRFAESIKSIKRDKKLRISAHTGIVNEAQARILSEYLDMALVDIIGDDETVHEILGLDAGMEDYEESLRNISSVGIPLAPHIIVGLHNGELRGEFRALEMVRKFSPEVVVIVIFIPTEGTPMEGLAPPKIEDVVKVIVRARGMFDIPLSLSCVRPGGRYRSMLDTYAVLGGVDRIAVPSRSAYTISRRIGLDIVEVPKMCCSYKV